MNKDKVYFSSKELYFLPTIHRVKTHPDRPSIKVDYCSHRLRSIQQVIVDKSLTKDKKIKQSHSICLDRKKIRKEDNMYDKYQHLPKIIAKKYKKSYRGKVMENSICQGKGVKIKKEKRLERATDKVNAVNFDFSYYQEHYQNQLYQKVASIPFVLPQIPSTPNLALAKNIDENDIIQQNPKVKYTKLMMTEPSFQESELEKVPPFLLQLLEQEKAC